MAAVFLFGLIRDTQRALCLVIGGRAAWRGYAARRRPMLMKDKSESHDTSAGGSSSVLRHHPSVHWGGYKNVSF